MKDLFSKQAQLYALHRPKYPTILYPYLASLSPSTQLAWDVGAGSGQATVELAKCFDRVVATDLSESQLSRMQTLSTPPPSNIRTFVSAAEALSEEADAVLPDGAVSLVTVATAIHWFDRPAFFALARRKLASEGCVAFWCYSLFRTGDEAIDGLMDWLYHEPLGEQYWAFERKLVEARYAPIEVPTGFQEVAVDYERVGRMEAVWPFDSLLGHLGTWSAVQSYKDANGGQCPWTDEWLGKMQSLWGGPRTVTFSLSVRIVRKQ